MEASKKDEPIASVPAEVLDEEDDFDEFEQDDWEQDMNIEEDKIWRDDWEETGWGEEDPDDTFQRELKEQVLKAQSLHKAK